MNFKFPTSKGQKLRNLIPRASDLAINLLENILNFNPIKRLTASQCLQHPFFQCYDILSAYGLKINHSLNKVNNFPSQKEIIDINSNNTSNNTYGSTQQNKNVNKDTIVNNQQTSSNLVNNEINNEKKKIKSSNTVNFINPLNTNSNN